MTRDGGGGSWVTICIIGVFHGNRVNSRLRGEFRNKVNSCVLDRVLMKETYRLYKHNLGGARN